MSSPFSLTQNKVLFKLKFCNTVYVVDLVLYNETLKESINELIDLILILVYRVVEIHLLIDFYKHNH